MSDRDKQKKQDEKSTISNSLYARVNVGQNANKNTLDGPHPLHTGGSMNNKDEKNADTRSFTYLLKYYVIGLGIAALLVFGILQIFHNYFYGAGINQIFPALLALGGSLFVGLFLSGRILKKTK